MKKIFFQLFTISLLLYSSCTRITHDDPLTLLRKGFENPPVEARPRALWAWVDGNFDLSEITREMEEASRMGFGGFDIWDVWSVVDEEHKITPGPPFMSDEYLTGICHALREGKRLGLDMGLIISSGWNAGGPWTLPRYQTMGIYHSDTLVKGSKGLSLELKFPVLPSMAGKQGRKSGAIIPLRADGRPQYFKTVAVLAVNRDQDSILSPGTGIINLSEFAGNEGTLRADLPPGNWSIEWYVCTNTGQPMIASTPNSGGPMIDHFNPEASVYHINYFIEKLEKAMGVPLSESGLSYFYTDSYEVTGSLWTPNLAEEFEQRKGYSLIPWLPVLEGKTVGDEDLSSRFLFDFRQVLSDLIIESHYSKTREICEQHGVGFVAEAAGPGMPVHNCPFESLKSSGSLTFPRGEFWHIPTNSKFWLDLRSSEKSKHYLDELQVIKGVASASHIYNLKYVEAESFTGTHLWNEGPGDLKPDLDRAFCEGLNRVVFHTWPHTPANSGVPGWVYAFGTIMNENRVWWPMVKPFIDYTSRSSFLLQQGNFAGDILFYYGDSAPNFAPPKKIIPGLGPGYDYDYINTDVLLNKLTVTGGKLTLPRGQEYSILVLPGSDAINPAGLEKVIELLEQGAIVAGPKPEKSHGLLNREENDSLVREMADKVWGKTPGENSLSRSYGKGHLYSGIPLREVLLENQVMPDLGFSGNAPPESLDFIHRTTAGAEVYFIRNTEDYKVSGILKLRSAGKNVETWDPATGKITGRKVFNSDGVITELPLQLEPLGSQFIVISGDIPRKPFKTFDPDKFKFKSPTPKKIPFLQKWTLYFPEEQKGPGTITPDSIMWWNDFPEDNIRFFSGIASYENDFEITGDPAPGTYELSLSELAEIAEIYVNGSFAGTIWHSPFRLDISKFCKEGKNHILIKVANTWANRLCGDARLPGNERITNTNVVRLPNAWAHPMKDIPLPSYPLINSGISGEISILEY